MYSIHIELSQNDNIIDKVILSLFKNIINNFANESINFYKEWGEFPFIYRERQINSILIPAIHEYTKNIFLELPFKDKNKKQRFLDIVTTKDNNIFLIELKHSWNSKTDSITSRADKEWETSIEQISDVTKSTIKNYYNYKDYNLYKIALLIMPTFMPANIEHKILKESPESYSKALLDNYYAKYYKKYQPNIVGSIKITNPNDFTHEYINAKQIYPFISFIGRVEKL